MTNPTSDHNHIHVRPLIPAEFAHFLRDVNVNASRALLPADQRAELTFRDLDIQPGDRVRLTRKPSPRGGYVPPTPTDASTLEGVVLKVKQKKGASKVQIAGFDVAGNAVFWPVAQYRIEVLHRAYRWTDEDRLVCVVGAIGENHWALLSETDRERHRARFAERVQRVKKILAAVDTSVE